MQEKTKRPGRNTDVKKDSLLNSSQSLSNVTAGIVQSDVKYMAVHHETYANYIGNSTSKVWIRKGRKLGVTHFIRPADCSEDIDLSTKVL